MHFMNSSVQRQLKEALINSAVRGEPFDKLSANGINQSFLNLLVPTLLRGNEGVK